MIDARLVRRRPRKHRPQDGQQRHRAFVHSPSDQSQLAPLPVDDSSFEKQGEQRVVGVSHLPHVQDPGIVPRQKILHPERRQAHKIVRGFVLAALKRKTENNPPIIFQEPTYLDHYYGSHWLASTTDA